MSTDHILFVEYIFDEEKLFVYIYIYRYTFKNIFGW